jgi:molecular chaperone HtpG
MPKQKRILEINPDHPVVEKLHLMHVADSDSEEVGDWFRLLHDQALLAEGSPIADPATFARRMTTLMQRALE